MKLKLLGALMLLTFASSDATSKSSGSKTVYEENLSGEWQVSVYGPYCRAPQHLKLLPQNDELDPIRVRCVFPEGK